MSSLLFSPACWLARSLTLLIVCLALVTPPAPPAHAQAPALLSGGAWETIAHGNNVWSLAREGATTLWAGTWDGGVVRWDLSNPTAPTYRQYLYPQDPLPSNTVRDIVVDRQGARWFATDRGLARLGPDESWTTYTFSNTLTVSAVPVETVALDRPAGTREVAVVNYDASAVQAEFAGLFFQFDGDPTVYRFYRVSTGRSGPLLNQTVIHIDPPLQQPVAAATPIYPVIAGLPSDNVTALAVGLDGALWVGTQPVRRRVSAEECFAPPGASLNGEGVDQFCDQMRYIGGGVARLDPATGAWTAWRSAPTPGEQNVASNSVTDIAVEPGSGDVWVTFWPSWAWFEPHRDVNALQPGHWRPGHDGGISRWNGAAWTTFQYRYCDGDDLEHCVAGQVMRKNTVSAVTIDQRGAKWFGIQGRGLLVVKGQGAWSGDWVEVAPATGHLTDSTIYSLAVDSQNRVWAATANATGFGADISIVRAECVVTPPTPPTPTPTPTPTPANDPTCWSHLTTAQGLGANTVKALLPDGAWMWAGTTDPRGAGRGVQAFDADLHLTRDIRAAGPASNTISKVALRPNGEVWVGTGRPEAAGYGAGVSVLAGAEADWRSPTAWRHYTGGFTTGPQVAVSAEDVQVGAALLWVTTPNNTQAECEALSPGGAALSVQIGDDDIIYEATFGWYRNTSGPQCYLLLAAGVWADRPAGTPVYSVVRKELAGDNIADITFDDRGRVWIGARGEHVKQSAWSVGQYFYLDGGLTTFDGSRWTSYQQGVAGLTSNPPYIDGNAVTAVLPRGGTCDNVERVWVGMGSPRDSMGWGVNRLLPLAGTVDAMDTSQMPSPGVSDLALDPTTCDVWAAFHPAYRFMVGAPGAQAPGGVARWRASDELWTPYSRETSAGLPGADYRTILADRRGRVWAGSSTLPSLTLIPDWVTHQRHTDATLSQFRDGAWQVAAGWEREGYVSDLVEDSAGRVWAATTHEWIADVESDANPLIDYAYAQPLTTTAVHVLDGETWQAVEMGHFPFPDDNIASLAEAANGDMWFGLAHGGLLKWRAHVPPTPTPTSTATATATTTPAPTATPTLTASVTATPTWTLVPSVTPARTATPTATATRRAPVYRLFLPHILNSNAGVAPSVTPTDPVAPVETATATETPTSTILPTSAASLTSTPTPTLTLTVSPTASLTPSPTPSPTASATASPTTTRTPTASATPTATRTPTWRPVASGVTVGLRAVACAHADACWAVGEGGVIVRWTGSSWLDQPSPTTANLNALALLSPTEGWAVGDNQTILRLAAGVWSVWDLSDTPGVPLGHYVGVVWLPQAPLNEPAGYIVAYSPNTQLPFLYWDRIAGRWLPGTLGEPASRLRGLFALPNAGHGVAFGDNSVVMKYTGEGLWSTDHVSQRDFSQIVTLTAGHLWQSAAGETPTGWLVGQRRTLAYYTASGCGAAETCWREASGAVVGADVPLVDLYAVQVVGPTQAWAVGAEGVVIRWDGTRWRLQTALGGAALRGLVILDEQTGWAVGDGGRILRYQ